MPREVLGELIPVGGGDPIPLIHEVMSIGRRQSCDICLNFQNVSGTHCELTYANGFWSIKDLGSTNGIKVNGVRTASKVLRPGDEVGVSSHRFTIQYQPAAGAMLEEALAEEEDVFGQSLMEKAGLEKPKKKPGDRR